MHHASGAATTWMEQPTASYLSNASCQQCCRLGGKIRFVKNIAMQILFILWVDVITIYKDIRFLKNFLLWI
jgi:hypothetical protein